MKLTGKQYDFAVSYVDCGNATVAYRKVYSTKSMSDRAVNVEASRLLNHPKVSLKIQELKKPVRDQAQISLGELIEGFRTAAEIAIQSGSASGLVAAYRELGRLGGLYPAKAHSVRVGPYEGFAEKLSQARARSAARREREKS